MHAHVLHTFAYVSAASAASPAPIQASMKESTKGGGRRRRPPPFVEAARSAASFMDECEAVAVAEAMAVAVTEAVAEADQSIRDQSIHDPSIYRETGFKRRNMKHSFHEKLAKASVYR